MGNRLEWLSPFAMRHSGRNGCCGKGGLFGGVTGVLSGGSDVCSLSCSDSLGSSWFLENHGRLCVGNMVGLFCSDQSLRGVKEFRFFEDCPDTIFIVYLFHLVNLELVCVSSLLVFWRGMDSAVAGSGQLFVNAYMLCRLMGRFLFIFLLCWPINLSKTRETKVGCLLVTGRYLTRSSFVYFSFQLW
jgi:hypothetical protein